MPQFWMERAKHQQACAHTHTHLFFFLLCVLFMCFYVFSLVITRALPEPQGTGKEDKHGLMWSNFPPSENKERENKRKRKPKKIETTRKWDAKCDCLLNHIQKWFKVTIFPPVVLHTWGIIKPDVLHTATMRNHWLRNWIVGYCAV